MNASGGIEGVWPLSVLWLNVLADMLAAMSYLLIPLIIIYIVLRRPDMKFRGMLTLLSVLFVCGGIMHLVAIATAWYGMDGIYGITKAVMAIVSLLTVYVLFRNLKSILSIPSPAQYQAALKKVSDEEFRSSLLEIEKRGEAIFKFSLELFPTGLLVVDGRQEIRIVNHALASMFGYEEEELIGQPLSILLSPELSTHHHFLVDEYLRVPAEREKVSAGRLVRGKTKSGTDISVEISLSAHEWEGETHAFASVVNLGEVISDKNLFFEHSNRLRRVIDATNDGIWEWNAQTGEVWFSAQFQDMMGMDPAHRKAGQPTLKQWFLHVHHEDRALLRRTYKEHVQSQKKYDVVCRALCKSGCYEWFHVRGDTVFDRDGTPILMSGTLTNINEVKQLEVEVAQKTQFLNAVLNKSLSAVFIYSYEEQKVVYVNERYTEILGYTQDELNRIQQEKGLLSLYHPDDVELVRQHIQRVAESSGDEDFSIEYRVRHRSGHWIWCLSRDSVHDLGGEIDSLFMSHHAGDHTITTPEKESSRIEILGTFVDVTPMKLREERIKQLALDLSSTFEQAAVGISHVDLDGRWLRANAKQCEILRYDYQELLKKDFYDVVHEEDVKSEWALVTSLMEGDNQSCSAEVRCVCGDGETIWVNLTASIVGHEGGEHSHFLLVVEDISERKAVEQALAESNAALERFAYSASHDLQEPLRKITSFSDILQHRLKDQLQTMDAGHEARYELGRIGDAASRMREMINSLLQLSRYSREAPEREIVSLSALLDRMKEDLSRLLEESQAQVVLESDVELYVDRAGFIQVLHNLISNSVRYARMDVPAHIVVRGWSERSSVYISVTDNGCGFESQYAQQIFEPFQRLVSKMTPGHGMGLSICQQIARAHRGSISVESQVGIGSCFTIEIPKEDSRDVRD
ncbi:PAS domain-containing sensor histidine kinase [Pseudomaricurvus sp.]|uniref:PAS domain-containing sensor histidine kinase n=1 Tax=Pseudomaricurvus sp. TaxID=2004510 RepID=UPI003F6BB1B9